MSSNQCRWEHECIDSSMMRRKQATKSTEHVPPFDRDGFILARSGKTSTPEAIANYWWGLCTACNTWIQSGIYTTDRPIRTSVSCISGTWDLGRHQAVADYRLPRADPAALNWTEIFNSCTTEYIWKSPWPPHLQKSSATCFDSCCTDLKPQAYQVADYRSVDTMSPEPTRLLILSKPHLEGSWGFDNTSGPDGSGDGIHSSFDM